MDFNKLEIKGEAVIIDTKIYNNKPNIQKIDFTIDILKKSPKLTKEQLRLAEPGNKIPVSTFQQIGKWCEECNDTEAHVHDPSRKKFRCLKCKTIKYYNNGK